MRYAPSYKVEAGINLTDITTDSFDVKFKDAITNQAGDFDIRIDNRRNRYTSTILGKYDPVKITLDGTLRFKGRVDSPVDDETKKDAKVYEITGRSDLGALMDIVDSMHIADMDAADVVTAIIDRYNAKRLTKDPAISIANNLPGGLVNLNFVWQRKSYHEMLIEVVNKLGSPALLGGVGAFYDFWVDPTDTFYIELAGGISSSVNLGYPGGIEQLQPKYVIDAFTVKNDIWTWANNSAGRIPLTMQPGYLSGGQVIDSWTEGNAADYSVSDATYLKLSDSNVTGSYLIGSYSLQIDINGQPPGRLYWFMDMPFSSRWPAQDPSGVMNTYNETEMNETMGMMNGLSFYFSAPAKFLFYIEVQDTSANLAQSQQLSWDGTQPVSGLPLGWQALSFPFGPTSNYAVQGTTGEFDWASVGEIRFVLPMPPSPITMFFDGFSIVKPLVVRNYDPAAVTRRTHTQVASGILDYQMAKLFGQSTLETLMQPQQYYEIKNVGRADIPAGYSFQAEGKTLVNRLGDYRYNKTEGWLIDLKGWEAT